MPRRYRNNEEDAASLDSLLDTLTNVVGILVILLILTQLGVAEALKKILTAGQSPAVAITPEALSAATARRAELERVVSELKAKRSGLDAARAEGDEAIAATDRLIAALRAQLDDAALAMADADKLRAELADRTAQADAMRQRLDAAEAELARLKAKLDTAKPASVPPAKIVTLPDPRTAPDGAKPVYIIVRDGHVTPLDLDALKAVAETIILRRLRLTPDQHNRVDCGKIVEAFDSMAIGDPSWRIRGDVQGDRIYVRFERRPAAGETIDQLARPSGAFMRTVRRTKQEGDYLRFLVWSDSFDAYVAARAIADGQDVPAGWELYDVKSEWRAWPLSKPLDCLSKPAPPPPPANPPPPQPVDPNAPPPPKPPLPEPDID